LIGSHGYHLQGIEDDFHAADAEDGICSRAGDRWVKDVLAQDQGNNHPAAVGIEPRRLDDHRKGNDFF
jgi:hypothetical protein